MSATNRMNKVYDHKSVEKPLYNLWEKKGYFTPKIGKGKKSFTIIMPPPNANGELHVGHAMFITLEDIMIRYHRMKGDPTLWLPGTDHAGIITQVVYERVLEKKGKSRHELGREEFFKQTYSFTKENKKHMESQLKSLGASCDWGREKFTLDPKISKAINYTFKLLYDDGLIYRGERIINWCPRCATALSDLEVEHVERKDHLWFIKYPIKEGGSLIVATTRPETMLGDTAVAVNPKDKRYKDLVGKTIVLPLIGREIPIIADELVGIEFGTGAVKVTPAHDPVDFEISQKHKLPRIQVIGFDNKMTKDAGEYSGLKVKEAREKILEDLKKISLLEKTEGITHSIGICERCQRIVEPLVSKQWFLAVNKKGKSGKIFAKDALDAVRTGKIKIEPKKFEKIYFNWMENIHDWCISRQIWWGHQIPVWYCKEQKNEACNNKGGEFISIESPKECPHCKSNKFEQEKDTLDTWFSSGQWPFTTLGWPEETEDFKHFYPTSVMETGYDILFFWVARMIMFGLYCTNKVPFRTVYLHGLIRDEHGKKMSKSKGNTIDPIQVAEKYGADAVRMALVFGTTAGNDSNLGEHKIKGMRNFSNKLWNIGRFVIDMKPEKHSGTVDKSKLNKDDKWILDELDKIVGSTTTNIERYRFSQAAEDLYDFIWHKYADKYIESSKNRRLEAQPVLEHVLKTFLELLQPYMPFITEDLWQRMKESGSIEEKEDLIVSAWPKVS